MVESILNTLNSIKSANHTLSHDVRVLVSFNGLPLVLEKFLQKALPNDTTLSVMCFPS